MKAANRFYVYIHRRRDSNEVFYVGKGTGGRSSRSWGRNRRWQAIANKHGFDCEIVEQGLFESDALDLEVELIKFYKECGCKLVNMTNGGEGLSGYVPTAEANEKRRQRKLGSKHSPESIAKMKAALSVPIICSNGMIFGSSKAAKEWVNSLGLASSPVTNTSAICACLKGRRKTAFGFGWRYLRDAEEMAAADTSRTETIQEGEFA